MIKLRLTLLLYFFIEITSGQIKINGLVVDKSNNKPIPYVNISIDETNIGTITNEKGMFNISISNKLLEKTIIFSHIQYDKKKITIQKLKDTIIKLENNTLELDEVVINSSDNSIINGILKNYKKNYPYNKNSFIVGTYREAIKNRNKYLYLSESIVMIKDRGYRRKVFNNKYYLLKKISDSGSILKNLDSIGKNYEENLKINGIYKMELNNFIRNHNTSPSNPFNPYLNKDIKKHFYTQIDSVKHKKSNNKYYYLSLLPKKDEIDTNIKLIVKHKDFAITEFKVNRSFFDISTSSKKEFKCLIKYRKFNDNKYYPILIESKENLDRGENINIRENYQIIREFITHEIIFLQKEAKPIIENSIEIDKEEYIYKQLYNKGKNIFPNINLMNTNDEMRKAKNDLSE